MSRRILTTLWNVALLKGTAGQARDLAVVRIAGATVTALCGIAAASTAQSLDAVPDAELRDRVQLALHADRYFYDGHVEVTVEDGVVHLHGLVFGDWDLRDAIRIAAKAAGDRAVINDLTIVVGGRR